VKLNVFSQFSSRLLWSGRAITQAINRFYWDDCFSRAASLSYTSLLALIPFAILVFWVFNSFGVEEETVKLTLEKLLSQALPAGDSELLSSLQSELYNYLHGIQTNIAQVIQVLGPVSIAVLFFTCIALLNTIESALNVVWRVSSNLNLWSKFLSFWAVVSLGPLLILVSFYWNAKVTAYLRDGSEQISTIVYLIDFFFPVLLVWVAISLLFFKIPSARVRVRDAAFGAFIAAMLFEFAKRGFAHYVAQTSTYSKLYGVIATIPLFLFWLYIVWMIVLLGAEISFQAGAIKILHSLKKYATELGESGGLIGLAILYHIGKRFNAGEPPLSEGDLAVESGLDPVLLRTCLDVLTNAEILTPQDERTLTRGLLRSPEKLLIRDVLMAFKARGFLKSTLDIDTVKSESDGVILNRVAAVQRANPARDDILSWSLEDLIAS
jgi:membrane protein